MYGGEYSKSHYENSCISIYKQHRYSRKVSIFKVSSFEADMF